MHYLSTVPFLASKVIGQEEMTVLYKLSFISID